MSPTQRWLCAAALLCLPLPLLAQATTPAGLWTTIDDETGKPKSKVMIEEHDGVYTGRIVELIREPGEDPNPMCNKCQGDLHGKPVKGLQIINGLKQDGDEWSGGTILDPKNGKTYKVKLELEDNGSKLSVRGYIGTPLLGRTQVWERSDTPATSP